MQYKINAHEPLTITCLCVEYSHCMCLHVYVRVYRGNGLSSMSTRKGKTLTGTAQHLSLSSTQKIEYIVL